MTAEEVAAKKRAGYRPQDVIASDPELARRIDLIAGGAFSPGDRGMFAPLVEDLLYRDPFFVLADFRSYLQCQHQVDTAWRSPTAWTRSSILNSARGGRFSSDRAMREYAHNIWKLTPVPSR
jgi:starch phosphorylase